MAQRGRNILLQVDIATVFTTVAGIRTRSLSITNDGVDITTSDNAPWKALLADTGARAVALSGSGVFEDNDAATALVEDSAFNGAIISCRLIFESLDTITGNFQIASFEHGGEHLGEQTFSISMVSSGVITLVRV